MTVAVAALLGGLSDEAVVVAALSRDAEVRLARRCLDVSDLLATVSSGAADVALIVPSARGLTVDLLERLAALVPVVAVADTREGGGEQSRALGLLPVGPDPAEVLDACRRAVARPRPVGRHGYSVPASSRPPTPTLPPSTGDVAPSSGGGARGRVVAVWGPVGSPGRTSTAVHCAGEAVASGAPGATVLLADADTYGPSVAVALGVLEEIPGLAAACRAATLHELTVPQLAELAPEVVPGLRILTGLTRTERWPELRPSALAQVWEVARALADLTLVDVGFCLEQDEELSFDTQAPRRNGAALGTLEAADEVLAVCRPDPVGVLRFVREWPHLTEAVTAPIRVVVAGVRSRTAGADSRREVLHLLEMHCGVRREEVVLVPDDRDAYDAALLRARTLAEAAPRSRARRELRRLAEQLLPREAVGDGVLVPV